MTQPEFPFRPGVTGDDIARLTIWLHANGWQTRQQLSGALCWSERKIRDVAESMGAKIVRGQRGFKLTSDLTRDELPDALQASDASCSQGKRMIDYGFSLRSALHQRFA